MVETTNRQVGSMQASPATSSYGSAFWERLWRSAGLQSLGCFILAYFIYGHQPEIGTPTDALVGFYTNNSTRILIAAVLSGLGVLNLMWFAAAIRTTFAEAGQGGWGAAATASSAAVGGLFLLIMSLVAVLAYSVAGSGNQAFTSGLNDFAWACWVLTSFPRAMLIMSAAFGLWRGKLISNALFAVGVAAIVLVLLGGTTWLKDGGFWAPDGAYSRLISPIIGILWLLVVSRVLLTQRSATSTGW